MPQMPVPVDEPARLDALRNLGIMYSAVEERYDRITRLAARLLDVPIAMVTLVDERVSFFKSMHGHMASQAPRESTFCGYAILEEDVMVVEDATKDERFANNPFVTGDPDIRFYAGQPVHTADGRIVGTLCVLGREARTFDPADRDTLRDLAALVDAELQREHLNYAQHAWLLERDELRARASTDDLTRTWNRGTIRELLGIEFGRAARGTPLTVAMIDLDLFKQVNDVYGHPAGDGVLAEVCRRIRRSVRSFDLLGRVGGEEFLLVLGNCDAKDARAICERIRVLVADKPVLDPEGTTIPVTISMGVASYSATTGEPDDLIAAADRALYRAKRSGRNRVECEISPVGV